MYFTFPILRKKISTVQATKHVCLEISWFTRKIVLDERNNISVMIVVERKLPKKA